MADNPSNTLEPMTLRIWRAILEESLTPEPEPPVRRRVRRYPIQIPVHVYFHARGFQHEVTLNLTNVSNGGVMGKSPKEIAMDTLVQIHVPVEGRHFVVNGTVVHCTSTLGGYKLGIQLQFAEEESLPTSESGPGAPGLARSAIFRSRPAARKSRT